MQVAPPQGRHKCNWEKKLDCMFTGLADVLCVGLEFDTLA